MQRLWFLDTGDSDCMGVHGYDCVHPDQLDWFREQNNAIEDTDPSKGQGFLFMHIPMIEYVHLYNDYNFFGHAEEAVCCQSVNTGLFGALKEQPCVNWVSVGHDHNNDYFGNYEGVNLAYGRKGGYGCYGPSYPMQRGARVFEVTESPFSIKTWVREESGEVKEQITSKHRRVTTMAQTECGGMDIKAQLLNDEPEEMMYLKDFYLRRPDLMHLVPDEFLN